MTLSSAPDAGRCRRPATSQTFLAGARDGNIESLAPDLTTDPLEDPGKTALSFVGREGGVGERYMRRYF